VPSVCSTYYKYIQSNFFNANVNSKSQLLPTIILMECNLFSANFINAKASLIRGEILVPTPNISSFVCPISPNCRRWRKCEKR